MYGLNTESQKVPKQFGKRRRHLAHNDIRHSTRLPYQYLLSYSPGGSMRREVGNGVH